MYLWIFFSRVGRGGVQGAKTMYGVGNLLKYQTLCNCAPTEPSLDHQASTQFTVSQSYFKE